MKKLLLTTFGLVLISTLAFAHKIDGKWTTKIETDNGKLSVYLIYKVEKKKVTGTVGSEMGETSIYNGTVKGNEFEYSFDIGDYTIEHKGKLISKNEIEITWESSQYGTVTYKLTKAEE